MNKVEELEALVKEQRAEMRLGNYQPLERFVAFSLDRLNKTTSTEYSSDTWDAFVTTFDEVTGSLRVPSSHRDGLCPIHGNKYISANDNKWWCRECEKERNRLRRRANGVLPRGKCIHGDEFRYTQPSGKTRCRECYKHVSRKYEAAHPRRHGASTTGPRA